MVKKPIAIKKNQKSGIKSYIYNIRKNEIMIMLKSHICLAQDWFAIDERFEGAVAGEDRGSPQAFD